MSLAKRLARSVARLYAYAMAPDDHAEEERREIIDQAGEAIDAANAIVWLEEEIAKGSTLSVYSGCDDEVFAGFDERAMTAGSDMMVAIALASCAAKSTSQPVDEWNQPRKNQGGGEPTS